MDDRFFLTSPSQSPFKTEQTSSSFNAHTVGNKMSPIKKEPMSFSPFKTSGLSPFKLINQSPSKGSYDEWDKDFIASFEETLFGMDDGIAASNLIDEMLKSPAGKAMLENRTSPLRMRNASAVRRLKISPANKNTSGSFQSLFQSNDNLVVGEINISAVKEEDVQKGYLHGQTLGNSANTLCAIDPNKMSDTPIKPGLSHSSENAPKRKLAMKMPEQVQPFQTYVIQDNPMSGIQQIRHEWPSKERLKYARLRFQKVLNSAVEREIEILRQQRNKSSAKGMQNAEKENKKKGHSQSKAKTVKGVKGKASKPKGKGKKSRNDKYPQIKMALSKPSLPKKGSGGGKTVQISKKLFQSSSRDNLDLGWYPDEDEDDDDEEDEWTAPVPFKTARNNSYFDDEDSSEDEDLDRYIFETQSGRQVTWKKRRLY